MANNGNHPQNDRPGWPSAKRQLFWLRWRFQTPEKRQEKFLRILWGARSWCDATHAHRSSQQMDALVKMGFASIDPTGDLSFYRMQEREEAARKSLLGWEALRVVESGLPSSALRLLLEAGAPVNFRETNNSNDSLLSAAVRRGNLDAVRLLTHAGASLDIVDTCDTSPLRLAVQFIDHGSILAPTREKEDIALSIMDTLLRSGAGVDFAELYFSNPELSHDRSPTPLLEAASRGWLAGMDRLLAFGALPSLEGPQSSASFAQKWMSSAVRWESSNRLHPRNSFPEVLDRLMIAGMDLDICDKDGRTPLFIAIDEGRIDLGCVLLDRGANPFAGSSLAHLIVRQCAVEGKQTQSFLEKMPEGFWDQVDSHGQRAIDMLIKAKQQGDIPPFQEHWLAFLSANTLSKDTSTAQVRLRPRSRL